MTGESNSEVWGKILEQLELLGDKLDRMTEEVAHNCEKLDKMRDSRQGSKEIPCMQPDSPRGSRYCHIGYISLERDEAREEFVESFDRRAKSIRERRLQRGRYDFGEPSRFPEYKFWMGRIRKAGNGFAPISYREAVEGKYG